MEFTIDEKALVKMNKAKVFNLFIYLETCLNCFNCPIHLQHLSFTLKAQALQPYSKIWKLILLWSTVYWANSPPILWDLYLDFQNTKLLNGMALLTLYESLDYQKQGKRGFFPFWHILFELWHKLLLPSELNSCFRHQRVYGKSMQERGNLRKP